MCFDSYTFLYCPLQVVSVKYNMIGPTVFFSSCLNILVNKCFGITMTSITSFSFTISTVEKWYTFEIIVLLSRWKNTDVKICMVNMVITIILPKILEQAMTVCVLFHYQDVSLSYYNFSKLSFHTSGQFLWTTRRIKSSYSIIYLTLHLVMKIHITQNHNLRLDYHNFELIYFYLWRCCAICKPLFHACQTC